MNLYDIFSATDLARGLSDNLISVRSDGAGLYIYNYTAAAMYTPGAWDNPAVRACRGLIADAQGAVHARPWAKFFNYGQPEAGELDLDGPALVTDKMDGSLGIIYHNLAGELKVATRGSFTSEQAIHATEWLNRQPWACKLETDWVTPLVEIVYPENRIVVDYGDTDELILLGGVTERGCYLGPNSAFLHNWRGRRVRELPHQTLREALEAPPRPGKEGLCVMRLTGESHIVKIKQEDYIALHKIVTGLSERSVWQRMVDDGSLCELLDELPDELHEWTSEVWHRLSDAAHDIETAAWVAHDAILDTLPAGWTRKDYAEQAKLHAELTPFLFMALDGRSVAGAILKTLKPAGDSRAKPTRSEDVA